MLHVVPTPIGNLKDITLRALEVLRAADRILSEDTRQTQKLLDHYEIKKPMVSFHEHSSRAKVPEILRLLEAGENLALVSDGGTPLISDPGFELVHEVIRAGLPLEVLPGPTALVTALAASGLAVDCFSFFGFLPPKTAARRRIFESLADREETLIFYESPYRLLKVLAEMREILGAREAVVARELTKKFEEIARGTLETLPESFSKRKIMGEIVILVAGAGRKKVFA